MKNENNGSGGMFLLVIILIAGYFLFFNKETWMGFYYANKDDLTKHIQSPELESIEECRGWVNRQVYIYNPADHMYDYECGKNCKFDKDYGLYVCKETIR